MRFDARQAKQIPPGEHITIDGFPGLRLQATETRRSWTYRYKSPVDERMRQIKLGEWPAMSYAAAIAEWEKLRSARDAGADPAAAKRAGKDAAATPSQYTVRKLCDDFLAGHVERHRKAKGADIIRRIFANKLTTIAHLPAESITRKQAFDLLESCAATPALAGTLRSALGGAWEYALDAGRLPDTSPNWWRLIMRGRLRSKGRKVEGARVVTKRVLSDTETGELIRWMPNFSQTLNDVLTLYLWTGTRGSEIVSMEVQEFTEEQDGLWWTVPKAKTKNVNRASATDLRVPIIGRAEQIVRRRMQIAKKGFLFPSTAAAGHKDQKLIQQSVYYRQPYCKNAPKEQRTRLPVSHWAPHDLRRTVRTMLASMECPHDVAESILGHVLPGVAGVYNRHTYDKERRVWLTRIAEKMEQLAITRPE
ncbi:integrase family protein [Caballeronia sp. LZ001]|uniref:tyrosine-type recombinase/integrase n=1 Tax=Caballeronia sp. LZ001 TaxID=3038553 RepID=UPI002862AD92|nr:integrase family protein [Caballeronia sp. LZ001]MDR5800678.1 integrase family protein [Caballeronia sp. LZ001]